MILNNFVVNIMANIQLFQRMVQLATKLLWIMINWSKVLWSANILLLEEWLSLTQKVA